jgi:hypothetical protein
VWETKARPTASDFGKQDEGRACEEARASGKILVGLTDLAGVLEGRPGMRAMLWANGDRRRRQFASIRRSDPRAHGAAQRGARRSPSTSAAAGRTAVRCLRVRARPAGPRRLRRLIESPDLRQPTDTMSVASGTDFLRPATRFRPCFPPRRRGGGAGGRRGVDRTGDYRRLTIPTCPVADPALKSPAPNAGEITP